METPDDLKLINRNNPFFGVPYGPFGSISVGASQTQFMDLYNIIQQHIQDNTIPTEYRSRLQIAAYNLMYAQGDAQRREAKDEISNIIGQITQFKESQKTLPGNVINELTNAGFSRSAAMQAVNGTAFAPASTENLTAAAPDSASTIGEAINTAVSTVSSLYSICASASRLGIDLRTANAGAEMAKVNAEQAQLALSGLKASDQFMTAFGALKREGKVPSDFSNTQDEILDLIKANPNIPECSNFINGSLADGSFYSRFSQFYTTESLNGRSTNEFYRMQLQLRKTLDELSIDKLDVEIQENLELLEKLMYEVGESKMDYELKQVSFADQKAYVSQKWHNALAAISAYDPNDPEKIPFSLKIALQDQETMYYASKLALLATNGSYGALAELQSKCPNLYKAVMLMSQDAVTASLQNFISLGNMTIHQQASETIASLTFGSETLELSPAALKFFEYLGLNLPSKPGVPMQDALDLATDAANDVANVVSDSKTALPETLGNGISNASDFLNSPRGQWMFAPPRAFINWRERMNNQYQNEVAKRINRSRKFKK